jgi:hypothetical protein
MLILYTLFGVPVDFLLTSCGNCVEITIESAWKKLVKLFQTANQIGS